MLSIRLTRTGKKKAPTYRVVVMEKRRDPWAKAIEILGHHNPRTKETVLKNDRITHWIKQGAQATPTVWNMLLEQKVVEGKKESVSHLSKSRQKKLEDTALKAKEKEAQAKAKTEEEAMTKKEEKPQEEKSAE